jgi:pimeloyl-ACP methyl ester carboxylesterase
MNNAADLLHAPHDTALLPRRMFLSVGAAVLGAASVAGAAADKGCEFADVGTGDPGPTDRPLPAQVGAHEGFAPLSSAKLWYWDTGGRGAPIVLLHPFTGSGRVWLYQQPVFAQAGYRVIGYSRRGFENSERGPMDAPGIGAGDLHAFLEHLLIERCHLVACAGGAFVAIDYALSHPERLATLTLACSILGIEDAALTPMIAALQSPEFNELPAYIRELGPSYRAIAPQGTLRWRELEQTSMSGTKFRQPNANPVTLAALARVKPPTLMLCGDADLIAPPPIMRRMAQHIPIAELRIFPECGHSAYWERPDLFNSAVLRFIQQHNTLRAS